MLHKLDIKYKLQVSCTKANGFIYKHPQATINI